MYQGGKINAQQNLSLLSGDLLSQKEGVHETRNVQAAGSVGAMSDLSRAAMRSKLARLRDMAGVELTSSLSNEQLATVLAHFDFDEHAAAQAFHLGTYTLRLAAIFSLPFPFLPPFLYIYRCILPLLLFYALATVYEHS